MGENQFKYRGPEWDREDVRPQAQGSQIDEFSSDLNKGRYAEATDHVYAIPESATDDLDSYEGRLDAHIANQNPSLKESLGTETISASQLEKSENAKLKNRIAEYGETNNLDYQVHEVLDMLSGAIEDALEQAQKYRNLSSKNKFMGIPIYSSLKKISASKKFRELMANIEETYMKLPENMREKRYMDLLNHDKISKTYGKGDKLEATGEAVATAGVGAALGGYAMVAKTTMGIGMTAMPGVGIAALIGGGAWAAMKVGALGALAGSVMKTFGRFKSIDSDYELDKAIHELHGLHEKVHGYKNGAKPGQYQELYAGNAMTNLEMMAGNSGGSVGTGLAAGMIGGALMR
ncbi:hypothetical protein KKD70_02890 [Patescibacteria group bacterium]|nr:hypothetical protein [Patescibacteria group bacterium]